jgi:hypothetical protein
LNKSIAQRRISKQEAMCELAKLPMVICSETIETVSLSGYTKITDGSSNQYKTFLSRYKNKTELLDHSLHEYFHKIKNNTAGQKREIVPHYVGGSGQPKYPVTENYARIELLKHRPWKTTLSQPTTENVLQQFKTFLNDPKCPRIVKLSYERAKVKFQQQKKGMKEVIAIDQEFSRPLSGITDQETIDVLNTSNNIAATTDEFQNCEDRGLDIGQNCNWSKRRYNVGFISFCFVFFTFYLNTISPFFPNFFLKKDTK